MAHLRHRAMSGMKSLKSADGGNLIARSTGPASCELQGDAMVQSHVKEESSASLRGNSPGVENTGSANLQNGIPLEIKIPAASPWKLDAFAESF